MREAHLLSIIHEDDELPQKSHPTYGSEPRTAAPHVVSGYLFGGVRLPTDPAGRASQSNSGPVIRLRRGAPALEVEGTSLLVAPFRIRRYGLTYVSSTALSIELTHVRPGRYRVLAVHNFRVEDRSPNLDECVAGVFLARRKGRGWEEPERFPIECRSIEVLGEVRVQVSPPGNGGTRR